MSDTKIVSGYEIPKGTTKKVCNLFRKMSGNGMLILEADDGLGMITKNEFVGLAEAIGLSVYYPKYNNPYCCVVIDENLHVRTKLK